MHLVIRGGVDLVYIQMYEYIYFAYSYIQSAMSAHICMFMYRCAGVHVFTKNWHGLLDGETNLVPSVPGLLSLTKMVPVVGSVAGAAAGSLIDWYFCHSAIDFASWPRSSGLLLRNLS